MHLLSCFCSLMLVVVPKKFEARMTTGLLNDKDVVLGLCPRVRLILRICQPARRVRPAHSVSKPSLSKSTMLNKASGFVLERGPVVAMSVFKTDVHRNISN